MNSKLAIVIPCYNVANYVTQAYQSIEDANVEIVFVIDGSPDNTEDVVREITKGDQRVKIISRANKGYFNTVVEGIENTSAPWIKILEPDDFFVPGSLKKMLNFIDQTDADVVLTNVWLYKNDKTIKTVHPFFHPIPGYINIGRPFIHTLTFKRRLIPNLRQVSGRRFSYGDNIIVDMIRIACKKVVRAKMPFYTYRKGHEGQSTSKEMSLKARGDYWRVIEAIDELKYGRGCKTTQGVLVYAYKKVSMGAIVKKEDLASLRKQFEPIRKEYRIQMRGWRLFQSLYLNVKPLRPLLRLFVH